VSASQALILFLKIHNHL